MIFVKLFLAHLIGDFLLQPESWVKEKEQKKIRSNKLILHALIHFGLMLALLPDLKIIPALLVITALHIVMDIIKLYAQKEKTRRRWFFIDQMVHVLVLIIAAAIISSQDISKEVVRLLDNETFWVISTGIIFLSFPSALMIRVAISKWSPALPEEKSGGEKANDSLASAGKIIGILERSFVYVLVLAGQWQAVGFLLAAKSVFRFGDLKEMRDRKLTEYVLIGTLMSFGIALLTGLATVYFLGFG